LAVSAVDVTTAVAFQAGELLLAGVVQIPNAAAQELAQSGDPAAALAAGATRAGQVIGSASAPVVSAVNTAVTNIRNSLADPFPSTAKTTTTTLTVKTDEPKPSDARLTAKKKPAEKSSVTTTSEATADSDTPKVAASEPAGKKPKTGLKRNDQGDDQSEHPRKKANAGSLRRG
jgi:hypothetical protein